MSTMNQLGKYQPYQQYEFIDVPWYKQKPTHWLSVKFKHSFNEKRKVNNPNLPAGAISFGEVIYKDEEKLSQDTKDSYQEVLAGEFLINPLNLNFDLKSLRTALSTIDVVVSTGYIVLTMENKLNPRFSRWLLQQFDVSHMKTLGSGVRQTINYNDIGNSLFCLPTPEEQRTIAAFLDYETARIDQLIAKQRQLIELLKEKRQAVISHAVTKGLNPNAPMKDSGVEWLGQVPEHWSTNRIGWSCRVGNGCTPNRDNSAYWENGTFPWLNSGKVNDIRIVSAEQFVTKTALSECSLPRVPAGSILMAITGEGKTRGSVAITSIEATLSQHLAYITVTSKKLFPAYLFLWLESQYEKIRFISEGWGSTKAAITCGDINSYPFPEPPIHEQEIIVNYVENQKNQFDYLIEKSMLMIKHLQERRTALISAAVTGKIDLRGWQPPKSEVAA